MVNVIALQSFDHFGMRRRDQRFSVSDSHSAALARKGLVKIARPAPPKAEPKRKKAKQ